MKFTFALDKKDYLSYALFTASKSTLIRKKRKQTIFLLSGFFIFIALSSYSKNTTSYGLLISLISYMLIIGLYIFFQKYIYKRNIEKGVLETYKNLFKRTIHVEILPAEIIIKDQVGESRLDPAQLDNIYETGTYFFLRFKNFRTLIIPKEQLPADEFTQNVNDIIQAYNIPFTQQLHWKFR